jgi:hypothetical protein
MQIVGAIGKAKISYRYKKEIKIYLKPKGPKVTSQVTRRKHPWVFQKMAVVGN